MIQIIAKIGQLILNPISKLGMFTRFTKNGIKSIFIPPVSFSLLLIQIEFIGNRSIVIILMSGVMVGGIFGFQLGEIFQIFGAESMIGAAAGFALSRELAPIIGAFLVTGRAGSAMAAELATMKVNEQIDAMQVMSVNPMHYLVAPRVLASILTLPILIVIFIFSGVLSAFIIGIIFYNIDIADFFAKIRWIISIKDIFMGMQKAAVFGIVFSMVGCYQGFMTRGGAKGVGSATTRAVVISYVAILVLDYLMTYLQFMFE